MTIQQANVLLTCESIKKSFFGVEVLHGISLDVVAGEVHALVGENGAGKSTLVKILSGVHGRDSGIVRLAGEEFSPASPNDSLNNGIVTIQQDQNMVLDLTVADNIVLGREVIQGLRINERANLSRATTVLERIGAKIDPRARLRDLTIAQRQMVEIARALIYEAKIMIFDEPTSSLGAEEVTALFTLIEQLRDEGVGIIFISHRMPEVFELADRITVLKDGQTISTESIKDHTPETVAALMVGRNLGDKVFINHDVGGLTFEVKNLTVNNRPPVSFSVNSGEIVGIAGLVGAGRSTLVRAIFGDIPSQGHLYLRGKRVEIASPRQAINAGIALLTEDRKLDGLLMDFSVATNITLANLKELFPVLLRRGKEKGIGDGFIEQLGIRAPSSAFLVRNLSGGNQQKVVLAKWIQSTADVLILDEPTKGVDVGAKEELYYTINKLAEAGKAVIVVSSELPELLKLSNRILVMRRGQLVGVIPHETASEESILSLALGVKS